METKSRIGRVARGLKSYLCKQCREGTLPHRTRTFDDGCSGCVEKKARHDELAAHCGVPAPGENHVACAKCSELVGKPMRTGDEPRPEKFRAGNWKWQAMSTERKQDVAKRHSRENRARRSAGE